MISRVFPRGSLFAGIKARDPSQGNVDGKAEPFPYASQDIVMNIGQAGLPVL